jgi:peroxiredoxin
MSIASATTSHGSDALAGAAKTAPRWLLAGGMLLAVAVIAAFFLQVAWGNLLITPWYLPVGGTVAALLVLAAAIGQRRWWQFGLALACAALAGFEWLLVLVFTVLPSYTGPVAAGTPMPAFRATLADGTEIDESYFQRGRTTAVIFFQGRWCPFCMTQLRELEAHHAAFDRVKADVVVVSLEDVASAAETQHDFPHLKAVSDEREGLSGAIDLINRQASPEGKDIAAPTILLVDGNGVVQWLHRPTRFIARPSAAELTAKIEALPGR